MVLTHGPIFQEIAMASARNAIALAEERIAAAMLIYPHWFVQCNKSSRTKAQQARNTELKRVYRRAARAKRLAGRV